MNGTRPYHKTNTLDWTPERVEQLRKLWAAGFSASQIVRLMGGCTRNAVIGKAHRIGLEARKTPTRTLKLRPRTKPLPKQPCTPGSVPLLNLTTGACRYPMGEPQHPEFGFCGCAQMEGSSYCPDHHHLAHTRKPDRRAAQLEHEPMKRAA